MTVLVTGVRGRIGRRVADQLLAQGVDVRGTSADPAGVVGAGFPVAHVDLRQPVGLDATLSGVDQVFLYAAHDRADDVADLIAAAGVEHVVVLSSASVEIPAAQQVSHHHKVVEDAVRDRGLRTTALRPNAFATNTLSWAAGVRVGSVAVPYPDAYVEPIHEDDVADAAVAVLTAPATGDRSCFMTGGESMTQRQQLEVLAATVGHDVEVEALTPDAWREQMSGFMPGFVADALLGLWRDAVGVPGRVDGTVRDITGQQPRSFAQWAADNVDNFR